MDLYGSNLSILHFPLESRVHNFDFVIAQLMTQSGYEPTSPFSALALPPLCETSSLTVQCAQLLDLLSAPHRSTHAHSIRGLQQLLGRLTCLQYELSLPLLFTFYLLQLALYQGEVKLHLTANLSGIDLACKDRKVQDIRLRPHAQTVIVIIMLHFLWVPIHILWILCLSIFNIGGRVHHHVSDKLPLELGVFHVFDKQGTVDIGQFHLLDTKYPV